MNLVNGLELKMSVYKHVDWERYGNAIKRQTDLAEDLNIEMSADDIEMPKPVLGKIKIDPRSIVYYYESFSLESSQSTKPKLDCITLMYSPMEGVVEDLTVRHNYAEFEKMLNAWYEKNNIV